MKDRLPRGYKKFTKERDKAQTAYQRIENQIAEISGGGCGEATAFSIFEDIEHLTQTA